MSPYLNVGIPRDVFLQDSINSASSVTQTLSREVLEGQRKLMALATSRTNSGTLNTLPIQLNNGPLLHEKVGNLANYLLVFVVDRVKTEAHTIQFIW